MHKSNGTYHLGELQVALDHNHPAHILPPTILPEWQVLDVGCGAGQTLIAAYPDRVSYAIDIDMDALKLGKSLTDEVCFVCGRAEALPWPKEQFDLVIARVSLTYADTAAGLKEVHRVLKRGGRLWMTVQSFSMVLNERKPVNLKGWIFFAYITLNSFLFRLTQKQLPFQGKYETFHTTRGISLALSRSGFSEISIQRGRHFVVTARAA